jgi:hypothetical protein
MIRNLMLLAALAIPVPGLTQQVADSSFDAAVADPAYPRGTGPVIAIDEAHHNFHTMNGRYLPFARLMEADGYRVVANTAPFSRASLSGYQVLVIANAIGGEWDAGAYARPGFTDPEADAVRDWVRDGGRLLLIADHAPMGVAAEILAQRFGVGMSKGFTEDPEHFFRTFGGPSILLFSRQNGLLRNHAITRGLDSVVAFTGQSLGVPPGGEILLATGDSAIDHASPTPEQAAAQPNPAAAWRTAVAGLPVNPARGRALGVALTMGQGRVVVLGEAGMLSAQIVRGADGQVMGVMGMNVPGIGNKRFALNLMRWLSVAAP